MLSRANISCIGCNRTWLISDTRKVCFFYSRSFSSVLKSVSDSESCKIDSSVFIIWFWFVGKQTFFVVRTTVPAVKAVFPPHETYSRKIFFLVVCKEIFSLSPINVLDLLKNLFTKQQYFWNSRRKKRGNTFPPNKCVWRTYPGS